MKNFNENLKLRKTIMCINKEQERIELKKKINKGIDF